MHALRGLVVPWPCVVWAAAWILTLGTTDAPSDVLKRRWTRLQGTEQDDGLRAVAPDAQGNVFAAGKWYAEYASPESDFYVASWSPTGSNRWTRIWGSEEYDSAHGIAVDTNGNVYVAGYANGSVEGLGTDFCLSKWTTDGAREWIAFSSTIGWNDDMCLGEMGELYVVGRMSSGHMDVYLSKWTTGGTQEWTQVCGSAETDYDSRVALDGTSSVYVAGTTAGAFGGQTNSGRYDFFLVRWTPNGTQEWTRVWGSTTNDYVGGVAVAPDGCVYVAGSGGAVDGCTNTGGSDFYLTKWSAAGTQEWARMWGSIAGDYADGVAVDIASNVWVIGSTAGTIDGQSPVGSYDFCLTKWTPDGVRLGLWVFGGQGLENPWDLACDTHGNIVIVGESSGSLDGQPHAGDYDVCVVMCTEAGPTPLDFDGDGQADLALYNGPNGTWYLMQTTQGFAARPFGWDGPTPVPADYDGDDKTDLAVYDPASGTWYIMGSTEGFRKEPFGWNGPTPVPADYDGDGRADLALYHQASGMWYLLRSAAGFTTRQFGWSRAAAVPADYDGDGKADLAVHGPGGTWYVLRSKDGFTSRQFGWNGPTPVPADYDGDDQADLAVYDGPSGTWYLMQTSDGFAVRPFGWHGPVPVPGDYDGDTKTDLALYHPPTGTWYLMQSRDGFRTRQFGWSQPVPCGGRY